MTGRSLDADADLRAAGDAGAGAPGTSAGLLSGEPAGPVGGLTMLSQAAAGEACADGFCAIPDAGAEGSQTVDR